MARFEIMIPFILHWETGLKEEYILGHTLEQMFVQAKKTGYANDPNDSGGPTMCGVTLATYTAYRRKQGYQKTTISDLKNISFIAWKAILKDMFWQRWKADQINNDMIAAALVDWAWGSGVNGITYPQKLLGVVADGIVGPKTLAAVNNYPDQHELFDKIQEARNAYHYRCCYRGPNKTLPTKNARYFNGWNNRVASITWEGFNYKAKTKA